MSRSILLQIILLPLVSIASVPSSPIGNIKIRLVRWEMPKALSSNTSVALHNTVGACRPQAKIPRDPSGDVATEFFLDPPCILGMATFHLRNSSGDSYPDAMIPLHFFWNGYFSSILDIVMEGSGKTLATSMNEITLEAGSRLQQVQLYNFRLSISLVVEYQVLCADNYYGAGCRNFCAPRNDSFGHYACLSNGERECFKGWSGNYCDIPVCNERCEGKCVEPNVCKCAIGWIGPHCDFCQIRPGCRNGSCSKPFECNCTPGFGGHFCDVDLEYCTRYVPCKNGGSCRNGGADQFTCKCPRGYTGKRCEKPIQSVECHNGGIVVVTGAGTVCSCSEGFMGGLCEKRVEVEVNLSAVLQKHYKGIIFFLALAICCTALLVIFATRLWKQRHDTQSSQEAVLFFSSMTNINSALLDNYERTATENIYILNNI